MTIAANIAVMTALAAMAATSTWRRSQRSTRTPASGPMTRNGTELIASARLVRRADLVRSKVIHPITTESVQLKAPVPIVIAHMYRKFR